MLDWRVVLLDQTLKPRQDKTVNIAVVGDLHGHLHLLFAILGRWQRESGRTLSLILQVGDMGTFMPDSALDHATKRFAARDPEELGFGEFAGDDPPTTLMDPRPPLVFIPGNHEDFDYLSQSEMRVAASSPIYPVSADGRIHALRSGRVYTFEHDSERVRIGGVSGAANLKDKPGRHARCHLKEDDAVELAGAGRNGFDILISHDGPDSLWSGALRGGWGSSALRLVIEEVSPAFAFFGHYNIGAEWSIGRTQVVALNQDDDECPIRANRATRKTVRTAAQRRPLGHRRNVPDLDAAVARHRDDR